MLMEREHEIWPIVLWVEKHHGTDGPTYIAEQIGRLALDNDAGGIASWKAVARRYEQLKHRSGLPT